MYIKHNTSIVTTVFFLATTLCFTLAPFGQALAGGQGHRDGPGGFIVRHQLAFEGLAAVRTCPGPRMRPSHQ